MTRTYSTLLCFATLCLGAYTAEAQHNTDYLVLVTGDTLYGKVEHVKEEFASSSYYKKIRITNARGKTTRHKRKDVQAFKKYSKTYKSFWLSRANTAYGFSTTHYSINTAGQGKQHFLFELTVGAISHYHLEWWEQGDAGINWMDLIVKQGDTTMIRPTQGLFGLKRKVLNDYFTDCPELQKLINDKQIRKIEQVVDYYNGNCQ